MSNMQNIHILAATSRNAKMGNLQNMQITHHYQVPSYAAMP